MKLIDTSIQKIDAFQQSHHVIGFAYAVIKKYSDDEAGYKVALITYYVFWSLFPLLIVLTSILQLTLNSSSVLRAKVVNSVEHYLPIIGNELQNNIHSPHKTGLALALGILLILYGARGAADAMRYSLNHIWQVPRLRRPSGPKAVGRSLSIIIVGGVGLLLAGVLSGYTTSFGHLLISQILSSVISAVTLFAVLIFVIKMGTSKQLKRRVLLLSALIATIGLEIVQTFGGYIITHELKHLSLLYGTFALVLGLLFWIYLQTMIVLYALEIGSVYSFGLWPRSLNNKKLLATDHKAQALYAKRDLYLLDLDKDTD